MNNASSHPSGAETLLQSQERFRLLVESIRDYAIFMLDPDGIVATWNEGAERIKGYAAHEIIGRHFSTFYPREQVDNGYPDFELERAREDGRYEDEGWRVRKDGTLFWANVVITALRDPQGRIYGFAKITRDMTERRAHEEMLRQSEERFRLLVEGVRDYAIFMLDPKGFVASWNRGAERIKGYRADEIIGRHFSTFYTPEQVESGYPDYELEQALEVGRYEDEGWRVRRDGTHFWANVVITPLWDDSGRHYGFAKVTRDMTERKRIEALELAERQMFEFLAMLSHELRNPLAPISNAVYMLQLKPIDDPEIKWIRDVIDRQVSQLTRLVDDLLEVSRVTSGRIRLQTKKLDIASVMTAAIETSRPLIDSRRHALEISLPSEPTVVEGDPTRLGQVLVNLLNNAAKYTPEHGRIVVTVRHEGVNVAIRVCDNGAGIPPAFLPKIFDLFAQGERTLDRSEGGLGIGLTLVRRLVEMHGGTIEARSHGVGLGSEFTVRLPMVPPSTDASGSDAELAVADRPSRPLHVLVVDDNHDAATSMALFVRMWGYEVRTAHDGEGALVAVDAFGPDVILLDIGLPGLDGYEVASRLKANPSTERITLIAVSGYGQEEDRRHMREAGFTHTFVKPLDPALLREILASLDVDA